MTHIEEWTWDNDEWCTGWREAMAAFREDGVTPPPGYAIYVSGGGWRWAWGLGQASPYQIPRHPSVEESPQPLPTEGLAAASAWRDWES